MVLGIQEHQSGPSAYTPCRECVPGGNWETTPGVLGLLVHLCVLSDMTSRWCCCHSFIPRIQALTPTALVSLVLADSHLLYESDSWSLNPVTVLSPLRTCFFICKVIS